MKTRKDILAEYVRSRYPEIEKTFDFAAYSVGVALKEFSGCIKCIKEAFRGNGKKVDDVCDSESNGATSFAANQTPPIVGCVTSNLNITKRREK